MYDIFESDVYSFEEGMLTYYTLPEGVKDAIKRNVTIGMAFVKKGTGEVRHMAFRRYFRDYDRKEKSQKYYNMFATKNLMTVYDTNIYIQNRKTMDFQAAAKSSYRKIIIHNILGFLVGGEFYDTRDINKIRERFGEEIYNSITPGMMKAIEREKEQYDDNVEQIEKLNEMYLNESKRRLFEVLNKTSNFI